VIITTSLLFCIIVHNKKRKFSNKRILEELKMKYIHEDITEGDITEEDITEEDYLRRTDYLS
jgi:hypothetical protein